MKLKCRMRRRLWLGERRNGEEIHRGNGFPMIAQKCKPAFGRLRISGSPFHPTRDRSLGEIKADRDEFPMYPRRPLVGFSATIWKINS